MTRDETIALFLESQKADKPHLVWNNWAIKLRQEKERSMQNKTWSEIETNWQKQAEADFSNIDFAELCPEANSLVFTKFVFPDMANFSFCKFSKAACFDNISAFGPFGIRDSLFAGNAFFCQPNSTKTQFLMAFHTVAGLGSSSLHLKLILGLLPLILSDMPTSAKPASKATPISTTLRSD